MPVRVLPSPAIGVAVACLEHLDRPHRRDTQPTRARRGTHHGQKVRTDQTGRSDSDGRPDRTDDEIRDWARDHDLPYFDGQVHFPDYRIEYEADGREQHEDIELFTPHYRGAHAASRGKTGFRIYVVASRGSGGRSRPHPRDFDRDPVHRVVVMLGRVMKQAQGFHPCGISEGDILLPACVAPARIFR